MNGPEYYFPLGGRSDAFGFGRDLVEINPTGLPELFVQLRDLNDSQEVEKMKLQNI